MAEDPRTAYSLGEIKASLQALTEAVEKVGAQLADQNARLAHVEQKIAGAKLGAKIVIGSIGILSTIGGAALWAVSHIRIVP